MSTANLSPWNLRHGYAMGIFPMGDEEGVVHWYEPYDRALMPINGLRLSRSMQRFLRKTGFKITFDRAFEHVIRSCMRPQENWLTEEIIQAFVWVYRDGWAHSCEVWDGEELVGGTYGLALGTCFAAESMFHRRTNASKMALWAMIEQCRELGFTMFDAQQMNPHLASLGAVTIPQSEYLRRLDECLSRSTRWSHSLTMGF